MVYWHRMDVKKDYMIDEPAQVDVAAVVVDPRPAGVPAPR